MALRKKDLMDMFDMYTLTLNATVKKQILPVSGRGGQSAARDYIQAIALITEYIKATNNEDLSSIKTKDELWAPLHPATSFRLRAYTPCLAVRYDELKKPEQDKCFEDPNWVATSKENGCRTWVILTPDHKCHIYSRNYSDVDCSLLEYSSNIYQNPVADEIFAVDCEIKFEPGADISKDLAQLGLATDSSLENMVALLHTHPEDAIRIQQQYKALHGHDLVAFRLIAPLYVKGKNYLKRTLGEGMDIYDETLKLGQSFGLNLLPIDRCSGSRAEKEIFLNSIINNGGEGVVFHYRKGSYCTSENRSKTSFIKLKRTISAMENGTGLGDTIDAFVSGFKMGQNGTANEGIIGALEFSVNVTRADGSSYVHHIASVPNITREERILATWNNADGLYPQEWVDSNGLSHWASLNPDFDGLVGELSGQALSAKSQRLEHPRLLIWRTERTPESCIYSQEWLNSQTTGRGISYNTNSVANGYQGNIEDEIK